MTLEIDVVCLFPGMLEGPLSESIPGRTASAASSRSESTTCGSGASAGIGASTTRPTAGERAWSSGRSRSRRPRRAPPRRTPRRSSLDPGGEVFRQARAAELATRSHLILVCPRYEGVDERIRDLVDLELSIGDYVLSGGELAALVVIDAVDAPPARARSTTPRPSRNCSAPGSSSTRSTRGPRSSAAVACPDVLVSGHHEAVRRWRHEAAVERTQARRPDLLPPEG